MNERKFPFNFWEILVLVVVAVVLFALSLPTIGVGLRRGEFTQVLSNMKQLHLATQQMALDATTTGDTNLGWPGDIGGTVTNWETQLLKGGYLSTNDLILMLKVPYRNPGSPTLGECWDAFWHPPKLPTRNDAPMLVYAVKEADDGQVIFLSSANFTNTPAGGIFDPNSSKFPNRAVLIFRKAGDGAILQPNRLPTTNLGGYVPLCR